LRKAVHIIFGLLLIAAAVNLAQDLLITRDHVQLAVIAPAILAAACFGVLLLVRAFRAPK
jgi:hypothetical protein